SNAAAWQVRRCRGTLAAVRRGSHAKRNRCRGQLGRRSGGGCRDLRGGICHLWRSLLQAVDESQRLHERAIAGAPVEDGAFTFNAGPDRNRAGFGAEVGARGRPGHGRGRRRASLAVSRAVDAALFVRLQPGEVWLAGDGRDPLAARLAHRRRHYRRLALSAGHRATNATGLGYRANFSELSGWPALSIADSGSAHTAMACCRREWTFALYGVTS